MPLSKPCPRCCDLAEVKTYVGPSCKPVQTVAVAGSSFALRATEHLEDLDVWECQCGWAEDVEP